MSGHRSNMGSSKCSFCAQPLSRKQKMCNYSRAKKKLKLDSNSSTHEALHRALRSKDCSMVCHLLNTGHKLCYTNGTENCFVLITQNYSSKCLERVLTKQPYAIHCRGPEGQTLLMYAKDIDILKTLLKFDPDVNTCDDGGENVLIHLIAERTNKFKIFAWDCMFFEMIRCIIQHGININATDSHGKTAIEYLLEKESDQYFELINILLKAGAVIPRQDSTWRTPAMQIASKAYHEEYFNIIEELLKQGADPKARDKNDRNLMYHVIASYQTRTEYVIDFQQLSNQCSKLLDFGCELGGLDLEFLQAPYISDTFLSMHSYTLMSVNILCLLLHSRPFCRFVRELFQYNLTLSRSDSAVSELTCYLMGYRKWPITDEIFEIFEQTVMGLLACGVNVMQQATYWYYGTGVVHRDHSNRMPDALQLAVLVLLKVAVEVPRKDGVMKAFQITCKICATLLRHWPHPPLTLVLYPIHHDITLLDQRCQEIKSFCLRTLANFLERVGGRLPLGTPLFCTVKSSLEYACSMEPDDQNAAALFNKRHGEIPSLRETCRHAVRATLSRNTQQGLDLTSLRVLSHGEWREVPQQIQDYLNFRDQPEFCKDDLPEFSFCDEESSDCYGIADESSQSESGWSSNPSNLSSDSEHSE